MSATARRLSLVSCGHCRRLEPIQTTACSRCGASLNSRIPDSLKQTWALLLAAALLYIPANLLPVMRVTSLGRQQSDTILGGVIYFLQSGSWHLALIIFVASVLVPILKLAVLTGLLISVHRRSHWRPEERARMYRLTELVGRWSMVDIFVVALMAALVEFGALAAVEAGPGAYAFAAVVVLTMAAAKRFDPRLLWDALERNDG